MIVNGEFLSRLRKIFDLNLYEVKVWTSLLSRGVSTAGELSTISDVPRSRTYDILESLEKKGFVVLKLGKPIKFIALKPDEVVDRVKRNMLSNAQMKSKRLEETKGTDIIKELSNLYDNGIKFVEPADLSGSLKGRQNVYNHLDMMIKNAKKSAVIFTTADGLSRKFESLMPTLEKAKKRGINVRIAAPINSANYQVAKDLSKVAEVRALEKSHGRFALVDEEQLMFLLLDDKKVHPNYDVGVWLSSDYFAKSVSNMLETSWKGFVPLSKVKSK
ncbi:MAG: helix-turn-helix domain-containing protein [Candidatus Pacearchaeota archaeon]|nr:helix-turn-helix domain-containing protein [Candidatus Pacearchaeota archaeon]